MGMRKKESEVGVIIVDADVVHPKMEKHLTSLCAPLPMLHSPKTFLFFSSFFFFFSLPMFPFDISRIQHCSF